MHFTPQLATRFARSTNVLRSDSPLGEDQMRNAAPSIFAAGKHVSRSERYTYIPTIDVLHGLRREGFEPFMVAQGSSRVEGKADYTKHMLRLRHRGDNRDGNTSRTEANEIILINSHDGASSYQMMGGMLRFVCCNGLVIGDVMQDIRIPHKGDIRGEVIEGAFKVLEGFGQAEDSAWAMKQTCLSMEEENAYATAALALRFGEQAVEMGGGHIPAPVTASQLSDARRPEDIGPSLWNVFQRVSENVMRGGLPARTAQGRRARTRPIANIDRGVSLNRALWMLAEEMRRLKNRS